MGKDGDLSHRHSRCWDRTQRPGREIKRRKAVEPWEGRLQEAAPRPAVGTRRFPSLQHTRTEPAAPPGMGLNKMTSRVTDEDTEAQRGLALCSVSHSQWRPSRGCPGVRCALVPSPTAAWSTVRGLPRPQRVCLCREPNAAPGNGLSERVRFIQGELISPQPGLRALPPWRLSLPWLCPVDSQVASFPGEVSPAGAMASSSRGPGRTQHSLYHPAEPDKRA